jgi:CubicO group peptidase (beta-lactamase class C family)
MTVDTPYFIASVTKMYTAAVILKLHEQGKLNLDESIAAYLPAAQIDGIHVIGGTDYSRHIKVYQLINHTSGLPDYFEDKPKGGSSLADEIKQGHDRLLDLPQILAMVRTLTPKFEPGSRSGTKAHYADTNYQLLGAIMEAVTGQSIAEAFRTMIFAPLNLTQTYAYTASVAQSQPPPAAIYFKNRALHIPQLMASFAPDGGIVSTVPESLVFLRAFFDGKLFDPALFDRMMQQWNTVFFPIQYGYGLMRFKLPRILSPFQRIPEMLGHSGSTGSFAFYCPEKGVYMVGTINQIAARGKPFQLMAQIANSVK